MTMIEALARPDQPTATFAALEACVDAAIGVRLFTLMTLDHEAGLARRCYSNRPEAYPVSGAKPMIEDAWSARVIGQHEMFVANTIEEIAAVFGDHALIQSLGCESCLNIPVTVAGQVIGTLNCLHTAGHYTPERVAQADALKTPGALALLLALAWKEKP
ncbi:MAG: GAF domain-containing protein [Pseudomonadota bacterium]